MRWAMLCAESCRAASTDRDPDVRNGSKCDDYLLVCNIGDATGAGGSASTTVPASPEVRCFILNGGKLARHRRRPAILRCASWAAVRPISPVVRLPFGCGHFDHPGNGAMGQRRSFGHASYSPGLAQFLDIFEPAKWRAFDPGNAQSGVGLQDCVASATGFGDASGHRQVRH